MARKNLIYVVGVIILFSFSKEPNRIDWSSQKELNWNNYTGAPDYSDSFRDAVTASAILFSTKCHPSNILEVDIAAQFVKDQSWVKPVARTEYHLGHEQLHFDITELCVRKFRASIVGRTFLCSQQDEVQQLAEKIMQECVELQQKYDHETQYSLNKKKQAEWERYIQTDLVNLNQFEHQH